MRIIIALAAVVLASCGPSVDTVNGDGDSVTYPAGSFEIPKRFWGEYNELLSDCGTGANDSRLRITSNRVRFYESNQFLREIYHLQDGSVILIMEASGEGQSWVNTFGLNLSENRNELTLTFPTTADGEGSTATRFRCP